MTALILIYAVAVLALAIGVVGARRLVASLKTSGRAPPRPFPRLRAWAIGALALMAGLWSGDLVFWLPGGADRLEATLLGRQASPTGDTAQAATATAPSLSGPLRSLLTDRQWLNTAPLRAEDLRGKVVLVNFWTYSCINSLRALPYVQAWSEKYKDKGLVVIGVHTPEFAFEKDLANVRRATTAYGVGYPVALDSDFGVWRAFGNQAWPALYFVGPNGHVRRQVLGEGDYDRSERLIQTLLAQATGSAVADDLVTVNGQGPLAAADVRDLRSPETYVGLARASGFASPGGAKLNVSNVYRGASTLPLNRWSLAGAWTAGEEFATLDRPSGKIAYRFHARDLHLILAPPPDGRPIRFRITVDGAAPGRDHGVDVDANGAGEVRDARMYQLVRQAGPVGDRTFEVEFLDAGVRAYDFTFG